MFVASTVVSLGSLLNIPVTSSSSSAAAAAVTTSTAISALLNISTPTPTSPPPSSSASPLSSSWETQTPLLHTQESIHVIATAMWIVTMVVGSVGNVLLCVTIGLNSSLHTAMNTYVFSIGLVDLVTCVGLLPMRLAVENANHDGKDVSPEAENIEFFLRVFTDIGRLLLMQSLTLERYQAIASPFAATKAQARRRAKIVILLQGLLAFLAAALSVRYLCDTTLHYHCSSIGKGKATPTSNHSISSGTSTTIKLSTTTIPTSPQAIPPHTTTTTSIPTTKDIFSSDWGLLETYLELPLTLVTVSIIFSSYSFILTVSKQQKKKFSNRSNAHKTKKRKKTNKVSPESIIGETSQHSAISSRVDKISIDKNVSKFMEMLEPTSKKDRLPEPILVLPKSSHHIDTEKAQKNNLISLSLVDLQKRDRIHFTKRKHSLPENPDSNMTCTQGNTGIDYGPRIVNKAINTDNSDKERLHLSPLLQKQSIKYKNQPLLFRTASNLTISTTSQDGINNPQFSNNIGVEINIHKHEEDEITIFESTSLNQTRQSEMTEDFSNQTKEDNNSALKSKDISTTDRTQTLSPNLINPSATGMAGLPVSTDLGKQSDENNPTTPVDNCAAALDGAVCLMTNKNKLLGKRGVELKAAFKVGFLFCAFVCLWMPFPVSVTIIRALALSDKYQTYLNVTAILSSLTTCTAAMDAIVYGLFNQQIMDRLGSLKKTCRRRATAALSRWF